jgi:hypothetical protein
LDELNRDIAELKKDGMDIESHTMTDTNLNKLSANGLNYEIGGSKQCFVKHGYNTTSFCCWGNIRHRAKNRPGLSG